MTITIKDAIECANELNKQYLSKVKVLLDEYQKTGDVTKMEEAKYNIDISTAFLNLSNIFLNIRPK